MAKLKVKSVSLVSPLSQKEEILRFLQARGTLEIRPDVPLPPAPEADPEALSGLRAKIGQLEKALEVLSRRAPEKKPLLSMLEGRTEIGAEEFFASTSRVDAALESAEQILGCEETLVNAAVQKARIRTRIDRLQPWLNVVLPEETSSRVSALTGSVRRSETKESILSAVARDYPEIEAVDAEIWYEEPEAKGTEGVTVFSVYCLKDDAEEVETSLKNYGFLEAPSPEDGSFAETAEKQEALLRQVEEDEAKALERIRELAGVGAELKFASDVLRAKEDELSAAALAGQTQRVFCLKGWAAEKDAEKLKKQLENKFDAAVEIEDPGPDDEPPVILAGGFFSAPLQNITGMYSLPSRCDIDPTGFMAFFYYLFFGMMLSDAGYGLLIVLATAGVLLFKKNLEQRTRNTMKMYCFCGLSTVFWGAMYGSWFGDAGHVIMREFFHKDINPLPPLWTDAVTDTMNVLIVCFILGLAHLFWGVLMKGYTDLKQKKPLDAVFDTVPTILTVVGMCPIFFGLFVQETMPENYTPLAAFIFNTVSAVHTALKSVSVYILIAGLALVILTAGRHSKSIGGKLGGGFYAVYSLFSGYLGDVLSYARLLALGMATGVIAQVMNMLGTLPKNPVIKLFAFILVFIVGHAANLAINLIGAYVHTNRLQYVEFFSKFYEGGGRAFVPYEAKTNYYRFKEETSL